MTLRGTDPESHITEYTLVYEDLNYPGVNAWQSNVAVPLESYKFCSLAVIQSEISGGKSDIFIENRFSKQL